MKSPRISVITPVYNPGRRDLEECITSVLNQTYADWELILIDDCSPHRDVRRTLDRAAAIDERIRVHYRKENGGIVAASNSGLELARGELIALLDHDDALEPDALQSVVEVFDSDPLIDYVYTDESLMTEDGRLIERFYKPDWSPERFRHQMYVCHLSTVRRSLVDEVGGFRAGFDGSQDYDLLLRVTEKARRVGHVPKLLYHWRMAAASVANNAAAKPYAYDAGGRAVSAHLERIGVDAKVSRLESFPGNYSIQRVVRDVPSVEILVPSTRATGRVFGVHRDHCDATVENLRAATNYPSFMVTFQNNDGRGRASFYNEMIAKSTADIVVLASEYLEVDNPNWLSDLVSAMVDPGVVAASGLTYSADSRIEHAGFHFAGSFIERSHLRLGKDNRGQRALFETNHEVSAANAHCLAIRRSAVSAVGPIDDALPEPFDVADLCLRLRSDGSRILMVPSACFYEYSDESDAPRWRLRAPRQFRARWQEVFQHDPYRPARPLRDSYEAGRPYWTPTSLRQYSRDLSRQ